MAEKKKKLIDRVLDAPQDYNPLAEGAKSIKVYFSSNWRTHKNINAMANTAAKEELKNTKNLSGDKKTANQAFNRADNVYKQTKKKLNKQIPMKYNLFKYLP